MNPIRRTNRKSMNLPHSISLAVAALLVSGCSGNSSTPEAMPEATTVAGENADAGADAKTSSVASESVDAVTVIANQTVEAGCGVCIYHMPGIEGCPLALLIDGKPYLVGGAIWPNHDYCDFKCHAGVSGKIEGGRFVATSVEPTAASGETKDGSGA